MIKVEEIAKKYKGYEVDEEKLKEFLTPPKPKTVWDLKKGDIYWYFSSFGMFISDTWNNYDTDIARRSLGSCFLTKEDAEFEVERRKIEAILLKYGKKAKVLKMKNILFFMILLIKRLQFIRVEEFAIKALFILHPMF